MAHTQLLGMLALAMHTVPAGIGYSPAARLVGVHHRTRHSGAVSLSFDDGPQPGATEHFLVLLDRLDIRATFFMVGEQVASYRSLVSEVHSAGHEIGNHGYIHRNHLFRNPLTLLDDVERGAEAIANVTGRRPDLFRPPQGAVTTATCVAAARSGLSTVLWTSWGRDWRRQATASTITRDALRTMGPGSIVLLHDGDRYSGRTWSATYGAVEQIAAAIRANGLAIVPIGGKSSLA